jgi:hypothetical protein
MRRDDRTLDLLLDWEPPALLEAFDPDTVRAPTFRDKMARAVAVTLTQSPIPRDEIAARMTRWMGEKMPVSMLDAYASQAKKDHTISANRLAALCAATGDIRPLQLMANAMKYAVVEKKYLAAIDDAKLADKAEEIAILRKAKRRIWRGS